MTVDNVELACSPRDLLKKRCLCHDRIRQRTAAAARTSQRLNDVEVDVSVRFDSFQMSSSAIGSLAVGDVISLNHRTTMPLAITSAATTFALAVPGVSGKQLAALIVPSS